MEHRCSPSRRLRLGALAPPSGTRGRLALGAAAAGAGAASAGAAGVAAGASPAGRSEGASSGASISPVSRLTLAYRYSSNFFASFSSASRAARSLAQVARQRWNGPPGSFIDSTKSSCPSFHSLSACDEDGGEGRRERRAGGKYSCASVARRREGGSRSFARATGSDRGRTHARGSRSGRAGRAPSA